VKEREKRETVMQLGRVLWNTICN